MVRRVPRGWRRLVVRARVWRPMDLGRMARRIDVRKPIHAVVVGVILAGILAPVVNQLVINERYQLSWANKAVAERPSPSLMSKLHYDKEKRATIFNPDGDVSGMEPQDKLRASMGAGGKKDKQLYTATMPDDPTKGVMIQDNVNDISVTFKPQMALLDGRAQDGRVVYPLKDQDGQMVFTPKGNGIKEDIILTHRPKHDAADFKYQLEYPESVEARLEEDGRIGFYTGSPELFGNISYGSDKDRDMVEKARKNASKTYLMFSIPAPTIRETGKSSDAVKARFVLSGKTLTVQTTGLHKGSYPLSIDPTFLLTSTSDFVLGSIDDNIDLSVANQVGRQALIGGSTPGWTATDAPNLTYAQFATALVAYNGFLYMIGGGSGNGSSGTTTNDVRYICLNPTTGALGTNGGCTPAAWTNTGNGLLGTARQGLVAFGFNGYLYAIGGEDNAATPITTGSAHTVEYAKINANGTVGTWAYTTDQLNTARSYPAGALYQGVLYVMGGTSAVNNGTPQSTIEYARINGDGNITTWTQSSSSATGNLISARSRFRGAANNGYLYVAGGQTNGSTVIDDIDYAPIHSDGTVGAWVNISSFPTARRDAGFLMSNGYAYVFGGCTGAAQACAGFIKDNMYAIVNADGSLGQWQSTLPYNSGFNDGVADYNNRMPGGVAAYSNHLYFIGGCSSETATNNCATQLVGTFISNIDPVGRFDRGVQLNQTTPPYENNTPATARYGAQAAVLNGYMYYVGGCSAVNCAPFSTVVAYAPLNANGTIGTWGTTTALTSPDGNTAGRMGHTLIAYKDKLYVIGGIERNAGNTADVYQGSTLSNTQGASGVMGGTWSKETQVFPSSALRAFSTSVLWHDKIYVMGGRDSTTVSGNVYISTIGTTGALGAWSLSGTTITARWGHGGGIWGNWIYVVGGMSTATGTYTWIANTQAANAVQQLTINNDGTLSATVNAFAQGGAATDRRSYTGGYVHNGVIYSFGGTLNATATASAAIYWTSLNSSTGAPGTFVATNIGNLFSGTAGLATARFHTAAVSHGGYMYVLGGCTAGGSTTDFKTCSTIVTVANTTEASLPNNGGTGQNNAFTTATALPTATADHAAVAYNGYLYQIGGCTAYTTGVCTSGSNSSVIRSAPINPDTATAPGQLGSWATSGTALPAGKSLLQAVAYNGYLYVIGGRTDSTAAVATVSYTTLSNTGTLGGSWTSADLPGGAERNAFGATILNGYIYVAGGDNGSGTKKNDVYYAQLNTSDGSLATSWATTSSFTTARSAHSVVGYNGRVYIIGGTDGSNNLTDVQFASQNSDGTLGSFAYTTDVARGGTFRQAIGANGYMYFIGNEGSGTELTYANINANGTLGMIQRSVNVLAGAHAHGAAAFFDGNFYVIAGCTMTANVCTTGGLLTSDEFGGQQAITRVGHYSKLFDTQVDTSPTNVVINGAINGPGAAVEFKLQTASSSDPVLGVAQLIRPVIFNNFYSVQALNSSGANVGVALNYLFLITLDDSRSGTFPDVPNTGSGFAQTAVTDITLFYHANPGRRLRHGASFTTTGCNPTPIDGCLLDTAP